jgi:hypothetical protein
MMSTAASTSSTSVYWAVQSRSAEKRDVGHSCRECKKAFSLAETLTIRRGGRLELRYHAACFSGEADPRTQSGSSFNNTANGTLVSAAAPQGTYNKMRTSSHF